MIQGVWSDIDITGIMGVVTGFGLCVVVPIVWMLLAHQRKMTELVYGNQAQRSMTDERVARLEAEVGHMKRQLAENIIAFDDRRGTLHKLSPPQLPEVVQDS